MYNPRGLVPVRGRGWGRWSGPGAVSFGFRFGYWCSGCGWFAKSAGSATTWSREAYTLVIAYCWQRGSSSEPLLLISSPPPPRPRRWAPATGQPGIKGSFGVDSFWELVKPARPPSSVSCQIACGATCCFFDYLCGTTLTTTLDSNLVSVSPFSLVRILAPWTGQPDPN